MAEKYEKLPEDLLEDLNGLIKKFVISTKKVNYMFIGCFKQNKLIKITRIKDDITFLTDQHIMVSVNREMWDYMNDDTSNDGVGRKRLELLVREEFDGLQIDFEKDTVKVVRGKFNTSSSIIEKYTADVVKDAKYMEIAIFEQLKDKAKDQKSSDTIDIGS